MEQIFKFKQFDIVQDNAVHKVGTDAMLLGALVEMEHPRKILDIGTGTGVVAMMLAQKYPTSQISGIEIDQHAATIAKRNFSTNPFGNSIQLINQNFMEYSSGNQYDLIVSNPPYFDATMLSENKNRNLARQEDKMSLTAMIPHAMSLLESQGELWIIIPQERSASLLQNNSQFYLKKQIKIFGKPEHHIRDILVVTKYKTAPQIDSLTIRDQKGNYSQQYKNLTLDFHFNRL